MLWAQAFLFDAVTPVHCCWACWLLFVTGFGVSWRYLLSSLLRGVGFIVLNQKWVNFIKCFSTSPVWTVCISKSYFSRPSGRLHICTCVSGVCLQNHLKSFIPSCIETLWRNNELKPSNPPFSPRSRYSDNVCESQWMHILSLAWILEGC